METTKMIVVELTTPELVKLISVCNLAIAEEEAFVRDKHSVELKEMTVKSLRMIKSIKAKLKAAATERK